MEANAYDALYAAAGTGHIESNAVQISGDATAAKATLERLAKEHADRVVASQYVATADQLKTAGQAAGG